MDRFGEMNRLYFDPRQSGSFGGLPAAERYLKGLKRVWGLPRDTHSFLLAPLCATIPIMDELCRRSCNFINACLSSDCSLISFVARQGIFCSRMASPLGKNTHSCCMRYCGRTQDISFIRNNYINYRVTSNLPDTYYTQQVYYVSSAFCETVHLLFFVVMYLISDVCRD